MARFSVRPCSSLFKEPSSLQSRSAATRVICCFPNLPRSSRDPNNLSRLTTRYGALKGSPQKRARTLRQGGISDLKNPQGSSSASSLSARPPPSLAPTTTTIPKGVTPIGSLRTTRSTLKDIPRARGPLEKPAEKGRSIKRAFPSPSEDQPIPQRRRRQLIDEEAEDRMEREDAEERRQEEEEEQRQRQQQGKERERPPGPTLSPDEISEDNIEEAPQEERPNVKRLPQALRIMLNLRRGDPLGAPRLIKGWPAPTWTHYEEDGFGVFINRIKIHIRNLKALDPKNRGLVWTGSVPYIQPTSSTKQLNYIPLNGEDFEQVLAKAWKAEKKRLGDKGDVQVKVFVYLKDNEVGNQAAQGASQTRVEEAPRQINSVKKPDSRGTGQSTQTNLSSDRTSLAARVPQQQRSLARPPSSQERRPNAPILLPATDEFCIVRVKLWNDQWVPLRIHAGDLRQALGLGPVDRTPAGFTK